jgi:FkbM family methyltransferase
MPDLMRRFKDLRYRLFYGALLRRNLKLLTLGTSCSWNFYPGDLNPQSVIYCGGIGRDVTFEYALVQNFGCSIVMFDPSPTGMETMAKLENKIPQFKFFPVALTDHCGTIKLAPPQNADEGSWFAQTGDKASLEVSCVDLRTLMSRNGHDHVDLLKIDIEGAEYGVLDDLLKNRIPVKQVLVEFHHGILPGVRRGDSIRAILKMATAGYSLINHAGSNHAFYLSPRAFEKKRARFIKLKANK